MVKKHVFTKLVDTLHKDQPPLLVTIWFGANDGTISTVHVPLPVFKANLHAFITTLLDSAHAPRILLITPPPINVPKFGSRSSSAGAPATDADVAAAATAAAAGASSAGADGGGDSADAKGVRQAQRELGPRVYARKMAYAAAALDVAAELADPRVAACDVWRAVVQRGLRAAGRAELPAGEFCLDRPWESMVERRLPGAGLPLAEEFPDGMFVDRLHFGSLVRLWNGARSGADERRDMRLLMRQFWGRLRSIGRISCEAWHKNGHRGTAARNAFRKRYSTPIMHMMQLTMSYSLCAYDADVLYVVAISKQLISHRSSNLDSAYFLILVGSLP